MTRKIIATALILMTLTCKVAFSQASVNGQAYAEVIAALTANENTQMHFGRFSPEVSGGQIILTPDGVRISEGSVILGGGAAQAGQFIITGDIDATYSIQLPTGPAQLVHSGSNKTMTIDNWVSIPPAGNGTGTLTQGREIVFIGATLEVGSMESNPVGIYTGTYSLTFAYN